MPVGGFFETKSALLRWVASQYENLPHIKDGLKNIADELEKAAEEGAAVSVEVVAAAAGSALGGANE